MSARTVGGTPELSIDINVTGIEDGFSMDAVNTAHEMSQLYGPMSECLYSYMTGQADIITHGEQMSILRSINDLSISPLEIFTKETGEVDYDVEMVNARYGKSVPPSAIREVILSLFPNRKTLAYSAYNELRLGNDDEDELSDDEGTTDYSSRQSIYSLHDPDLPRGSAGIIVLNNSRAEVTVTIVTIRGYGVADISKRVKAALQEKYQSSRPKNVRNFFMVKSSQSGYELFPLDLKNKHEPNFIETNYNDDFMDVHNAIEKAIVEGQKGIVLLHGIPGSGKTHYLENIPFIPAINRKVIYVPPYMVRSLTDPNFIGFMVEEFKNAVVIIEDGEQAIGARDSGEFDSSAVSNILNLSDGMMGESLNILLVCTFNMDVHRVDAAIKRKGRMVAEYKFEALKKDKAQVLAKQLHGEGVEIVADMSLADIYGLDKENFAEIEPQKRSIGFIRG